MIAFLVLAVCYGPVCLDVELTPPTTTADCLKTHDDRAEAYIDEHPWLKLKSWHCFDLFAPERDA